MNEIVVNTPSFYVSYNEHIGSEPLAAMLDGILCSTFGVDKANIGRSETALCIKGVNNKMSGIKFLILYGDHRQQYKDAAEKGGLEACLDYFNANRDQASHASEHEPIEAKISF